MIQNNQKPVLDFPKMKELKQEHFDWQTINFFHNMSICAISETHKKIYAQVYKLLNPVKNL